MRGDTKTWRAIRRGAWAVLLGSLLIPSTYTVFRFISPALEGEGLGAERGDRALLLLQCFMGVVVSFLPVLAERKWPRVIPDAIFVSYYLFLFCAIFLGDVLQFFDRVPDWDSFLHVFSGAMFCALGFVLVRAMGGKTQVHFFYAALFAFCFSLACGTVWEVYEFTVDSLVDLNMQKYMTEAGVARVGQDALFDTMKDILCNLGGALVLVGFHFGSAKRRERAGNGA